MPVFERKAVTESKWMWRKCSVVRKAAGRYCKLPTSLLAIDFLVSQFGNKAAIGSTCTDLRATYEF